MKKSLCLLLAMLLCLSGCGRQVPYQRYSMSFFEYFDTIITITGYAQSQAEFDEAANQAKEQFGQLHRLFDNYNEYSGINNLCTLNRLAGSEAVKVEPELMDLLTYVKGLQDRYPDKVNIAMGAVLSLWHQAREDGRLPDGDALAHAAEHTDFNDVELNEQENTVFFRDPELKLDLGAVAKGYAVERVAQTLSQTMPHFLINAGGNVRCGEMPMDGRTAWSVSIQNPDTALTGQGDLLTTVSAANCSLVTSGDYQRYFEVDGVRYHHIIDPETLYPAERYHSVSVVTPDSGMADFLSTYLFVSSPEDGLALVESLKDTEALWVLSDGSIQRSSGFAALES